MHILICELLSGCPSVDAPPVRLLRTTLLQPLVDTPTLEERHDVVDYFLGNETLFFDLSSCLSKMGDLEVMYDSFLLSVGSLGVDSHPVTSH